MPEILTDAYLLFTFVFKQALMEVLLIEKDTFNCILDEHQLLCDMIISLAGHIRRKKPDEMLSVAEVCEFLRIAPSTLQSIRNSGKIGFVRDEGNGVKFPCREVLGYAERHGVTQKISANG